MKLNQICKFEMLLLLLYLRSTITWFNITKKNSNQILKHFIDSDADRCVYNIYGWFHIKPIGACTLTH